MARQDVAQLALNLCAAPGTTPRVVVAVDAAAWGALRPAVREDLTLPRGGAVVGWREDGDVVHVEVDPDVATTLRGMGEAHGLDVRDEGRAAA